MKTTFFTLTLLSMCIFSNAQKTVYSRNGKTQSYTKDNIDIIFTPSGVNYLQKTGPEAAALVSLIPTVIDFLWKTTTNALEKNAKKFTAELSKQKSNLDVGGSKVPDFRFVREIEIDGKMQNALTMQFRAAPITDFKGGFIYYIESLNLGYSAAKFKEKHKTLDYTLEIKVTYYVGNEKKVHELSPLSLQSIPFGDNNFEKGQNRTDILPLSAGGKIAEISIKIIESNPAKVKAEKILALWNENKDNVKTIINNFLPEQKKSSGPGSGDDDAGKGDREDGEKKDSPKQ